MLVFQYRYRTSHRQGYSLRIILECCHFEESNFLAPEEFVIENSYRPICFPCLQTTALITNTVKAPVCLELEFTAVYLYAILDH